MIRKEARNQVHQPSIHHKSGSTRPPQAKDNKLGTHLLQSPFENMNIPSFPVGRLQSMSEGISGSGLRVGYVLFGQPSGHKRYCRLGEVEGDVR